MRTVRELEQQYEASIGAKDGIYIHNNDAVNGYDIVDVSAKQKQIDKVCWEMSKFLIMSKLCCDLW